MSDSITVLYRHKDGTVSLPTTLELLRLLSDREAGRDSKPYRPPAGTITVVLDEAFEGV